VRDALILVGLLSFPGYLIYWILYHVRGERQRRLWVLVPAVLAWSAASFYCFIRPMLGCIGGHCAHTVSPFLELAVLYAFSSAVLIGLMHWKRDKPTRNEPGSAAQT
jgi:hypothetical protein